MGIRGLAAASLFVAAGASAQTTRVAIVAVGSDPVATGAAQQKLEKALASAPGLAVVPRAELALRLAAGLPPRTREDVKLASLFVQAKEAYFADRLVEARDRVNEAAKIVEAGNGAPDADRVAVLTWLTALDLAQSDTARAEENAAALLSLAPEAKPDLNVFRPSVARLIDEVRAKAPKPVDVKVEGAPVGAALDVDGRIVEPRFRIGPGKHRLTLRAPGYRTMTVPFDAQSDYVLELSPALDVGDALAPLSLAAWKAGDSRAPAELATRLGVDAVALVGLRADGAQRALVVRGGSLQHTVVVARTRDTETAMASLIGKVLAPANAVAAPVPTPAGRSAAPQRTSVSVDAGFLVAQRVRSLAGSGGSGFQASFAGVGGFVDASASVRVWTGGARVSWTSYDLSVARFEFPDDTTASARGGQTTRADLRAGRRLVGSPEAFSWLVQAEGAWETHAAEDLRAEGGDLGVFTSYDRFAAGIGTDVRVPVSAVRIDGGVSVHLLHAWREPSNPNGRTPTGAPALGLRFGVSVPVRKVWELQAHYRGELRSVSFQGTADAPVDPPVEEARLSEAIHAASVTFGRRF